MWAEAEVAAAAQKGALRHEQAVTSTATATVNIMGLLTQRKASQNTLRDERRRLEESWQADKSQLYCLKRTNVTNDRNNQYS
jgi:hypothetical protein